MWITDEPQANYRKFLFFYYNWNVYACFYVVIYPFFGEKMWIKSQKNFKFFGWNY